MIYSLTSSINPFANKHSQAGQLNPKQPTDIQVDVGTNWGLPADIFRNIFSLPAKLLLWNASLDSGKVSEEVIEDAKKYLHLNGLHDVYLSVNQYKPAEIWKRIFTNPNTSTFSKLTLGLAVGLQYQFWPYRLLGGESYDPLSNTVHLFSNDASLALHECGHAKDYNSRENPSLYLLFRNLPPIGPFTSLYQEFKATDHAIQYARNEGMTEMVKNSFKTLTPTFMTYVASALLTHPQLDWSQTSSLLSECGITYPECYIAKIEELTSILTPFLNDYKTYILGLVGIIATGHIIGHVLAAREPERSSSLKGEIPPPAAQKLLPI